MTPNPGLGRHLGTFDAVILGLTSMIGAGIFACFAPAAEAAGAGLMIGLAIAAAVAFCNATASAQLAAQYPEAGGTYVYGRERLGEWVGFLAGWSFVVGKTASCAAMALTFATYAAPAGWLRPVAVTAVVVLAAVNYRGVTRTAGLARIIVVFIMMTLLLVVIAGAAGKDPDGGINNPDLFAEGWYGILQSAGLLFFAFAGYARIATMGEEVKRPQRTIPLAIMTALMITLAIYTLIGFTLLYAIGPDRLASSGAPLAELVSVSGWSWADPIVRAGAAAASLGALLALLTGVGRTGLAMARNHDLPGWLSAVHPTFAVPHRAELALAVIVSALVVTVDLRGAIGFSSFGVLLYYLIANASAFTQGGDRRRYPKALQVVGAIGCLALVATLPTGSIVGGLVALGVGAGGRLIRVNRTRGAASR